MDFENQNQNRDFDFKIVILILKIKIVPTSVYNHAKFEEDLSSRFHVFPPQTDR